MKNAFYFLLSFLLASCVSAGARYKDEFPASQHVQHSMGYQIHRYRNVDVDLWIQHGVVKGYVTGLEGDRIIRLPDSDTCGVFMKIKFK